ncbi:hypothetical protein NE237_009014 [Protea cynaroides]|uniref:Uncharacterized protein n=1 Tax=Protea cynaroides TaxID=273540 RepID=A0A9Q0KXS5_9MAGN|nr:hypothetical protein NE237_009014 [Protea cynaroides]
MARPLTSNRVLGSSTATATTTITIEESSPSDSSQRPQQQALVLRLSRCPSTKKKKKKKKKVAWKEGTVDNEFLNKKAPRSAASSTRRSLSTRTIATRRSTIMDRRRELMPTHANEHGGGCCSYNDEASTSGVVIPMD